MSLPLPLRRPGFLALLLAIGGVVSLSDGVSASPGTPREPKEDSKISSAIRDALQEMQDTGVTRDNATAMGVYSLSVEGLLKIDEAGNIQTYIFVAGTGQDQLRDLENQEVAVDLVNDDLNIIQGWIPFDRVEDVAALEFVGRIQTPDYAHVRTGSVNTEGDQILRADAVRSQVGFVGSGIRVGVISDGVDSLAAA
jgi:hypothetical protein